MLPGDVFHQSRHAHLAFTEHADDAVEGIVCTAAEEYGLAVFDGRNGKEGLLVFLQRCPTLLAADAAYHLRSFIRLFRHKFISRFLYSLACLFLCFSRLRL